jgi:hypothetical protein
LPRRGGLGKLKVCIDLSTADYRVGLGKNMTAMISSLVSAIVVGIIGPLLTLFVKRHLENRRYPTPVHARLEKLAGTWYGYFSGKDYKLAVRVSLGHSGRRVIGEGEYVDEDGEEVRLKLYDGIV